MQIPPGPKDGLYRKVGGAGAPGGAKENSNGHQSGTLLERLPHG